MDVERSFWYTRLEFGGDQVFTFMNKTTCAKITPSNYLINVLAQMQLVIW